MSIKYNGEGFEVVHDSLADSLDYIGSYYVEDNISAEYMRKLYQDEIADNLHRILTKEN